MNGRRVRESEPDRRHAPGALDALDHRHSPDSPNHQHTRGGP